MLTTCKYFDLMGNRCSRVTDGKCDDLPECEFKYIEELKAKNATYEANADAVRKYITQNEQLKTHIDGLEKKNAELKAENNKLKQDKIGLHSEIKQLEQENYGLNQELLGYKKGVQASEIIELKQTLQEIKEIAEAPSPFVDNFKIKSATEVGYDYAAICKELELRLHKVLELITKAEREG